MNIKKHYLYKFTPVFLVSAVIAFTWMKLNDPCLGMVNETECLYGMKLAIIQPIFFGAKWLLVILVAMTFVPWRTYKTWALTLLPVSLLISYLLISNISVYSSGVLTISRAQMAVNCAVVLAALSVIFVLASELYWRRKSRIGV